MKKMKDFILDHLEGAIVALIIIGIVAIAFLVYYKSSFLNFFFLPVILAGYFLGKKRAVLAGIFCILLVILYLIFSPLLIEFLYNNYKSLIFIFLFKIITIGGIFYCLNQFLAKIPMASSKTKINLLAEFLAGISNITFLILSILSSNILYSGLGFLISTVIIIVVYLIFCKKHRILTKNGRIIFKIIISAMITISFFDVFYFLINIVWIGALFSILVYFILIIKLNITSIKTIKSIMTTLFEICKAVFKKKKNLKLKMS